jgi:hypothetical protein
MTKIDQDQFLFQVSKLCKNNKGSFYLTLKKHVPCQKYNKTYKKKN